MSPATGYTWFNGRMTGMPTPSGQALGYTWTNGRISAVALNGVALVSAAGYEPFGPVSVWQWGNGHKIFRDVPALRARRRVLTVATWLSTIQGEVDERFLATWRMAQRSGRPDGMHPLAHGLDRGRRTLQTGA